MQDKRVTVITKLQQIIIIIIIIIVRRRRRRRKNAIGSYLKELYVTSDRFKNETN